MLVSTTHASSNSGQEPVSQKTLIFSGLFRVPQFPKAEVLIHQASQSSWFSYMKRMLKDQFFKTSGLQFSELSRKRSLVGEEAVMLLVAMETGVSSGRLKLKNMRNMEKSNIL